MIEPDVTAEFGAALEERFAGWTVLADSVEREGMSVSLSRGSHSDAPRPLDVLCRLVSLLSGHAGLRDCVVGFAGTDRDIGRTAAHLWALTTGSAMRFAARLR